VNNPVVLLSPANPHLKGGQALIAEITEARAGLCAQCGELTSLFSSVSSRARLCARAVFSLSSSPGPWKIRITIVVNNPVVLLSPANPHLKGGQALIAEITDTKLPLILPLAVYSER
jgi:hypothetical protein